MTLFAFISIQLYQHSSNAILGRWIEPDTIIAPNALDGAAFLDEIGALKPLQFAILSEDHVDKVMGISSEAKTIAKLSIVHEGKGHFRVVSEDPTYDDRRNPVREYQVEEFNRKKGEIILGQRTPAYDVRHRIFISLREVGEKPGFFIQMVRPIGQRSYTSEFIPQLVAKTVQTPPTIAIPPTNSKPPTSVKTVETIYQSRFRDLLRNRPKYGIIRSQNRTAEVLNTGVVLLSDAASGEFLQRIEPLASGSTPLVYFEGSKLIVEFYELGQRVLFASADGAYLGVEKIEGFARCASIFNF